MKGQVPEGLPLTTSRIFLEFTSRVRLGSPKPYNSRHLGLPEHFQNCLPPSTAGDASFFRIGSGEGLSELVMEFPAVLRVFLILKRALAQTCLLAWYQERFFLLSHFWAFLGACVWGRGHPWYGTSAQPKSLHMFFTKMCPSGGTKYVSFE